MSVLAITGFVLAPGIASAQYDDGGFDDGIYDEGEQQAGPGVGTTEAEADEVSKGIWESPLVVTFRGGPMNFENANGQNDNRMSQGLNLVWNLTPTLMGLNLGVESGIHFSHIGAADSGFFGRSDEGQANAGANAFIVPLQAVVGTNITDSFNLAAHLGGSLLYRSVAESMQVGRGDGGTDSSTEIFPSVALNAGYSLGENTALNLRGDYIPTPQNDIVVATLGIGIGL